MKSESFSTYIEKNPLEMTKLFNSLNLKWITESLPGHSKYLEIKICLPAVGYVIRRSAVIGSHQQIKAESLATDLEILKLQF
jgi:hypothetical protein